MPIDFSSAMMASFLFGFLCGALFGLVLRSVITHFGR